MKGILSAIIWVPLIGAILVSFMPKDKEQAIRWAAFIFTLAPFIFSLIAFFGYDAKVGGLQFVEKYQWIKEFGLQYYLGVDGLSLPLVVLTTLTMVVSVLYSFVVKNRVKEYFIHMLLMSTFMVGVFIALDYILFYVFWEVGLIPMYFLIGIWGGAHREYAAIKFFLYTFFGSIFMLLAIFAIYFQVPESSRTFDMIALAKYSYSFKIQILAFLGVFIALAIKLPSFPFHTWLPDAHVEAPTAASVILAGVLLKMGGYGFGRILMPTVPDAFSYFVPLMSILGIVSIVYGAYLAMAQDDLKKMVAYSSISHMGFVTLGFAAINSIGIQGAVFQMVSHGLITGLMFLVVGMIHDRYHTRSIAELKGLFNDAPALSFIVILGVLGSLGMPAMSGFIGEWLAVAGVFKAQGLTYSILMAIGIILTAGYFFYTITTVFLKKFDVKIHELKASASGIVDLSIREYFVVVPLVALFVIFGVYPKPVLDLINAAMSAMLK